MFDHDSRVTQCTRSYCRMSRRTRPANSPRPIRDSVHRTPDSPWVTRRGCRWTGLQRAPYPRPKTSCSLAEALLPHPSLRRPFRSRESYTLGHVLSDRGSLRWSSGPTDVGPGTLLSQSLRPPFTKGLSRDLGFSVPLEGPLRPVKSLFTPKVKIFTTSSS